MIQQARASRSAAAAAVSRSTAPAVKPIAAATPSCSKCNSQTALRTARKGANAGSEFWGCARYPTCKGTR
jgi:restriction system protein